jgi:hypothetical protein
VNNNRADHDDDEDEWEPEVPTNNDELTGRMKLLIVNADLDKPIDERLDMFYAWLQVCFCDSSLLQIYISHFIRIT